MPTFKPLTTGQKIGPYEITGLLGKGGMGEVYRAEDSRLGRMVAVKVLRSQGSAQDESRRRFEIEARAIAGLNHPHICALFDIGEQEKCAYMVMEYLEGESLASRLQKGPLPIGEALRYAIQISDALDQAHRRGIAHRDIKPGNILLTKAGVKLLDFGLARLRVRTETLTDEDPTTITTEGTVLGTPQYMAPEQAEGRDVDRRADIFSLASVVYECITGLKAFPGKTTGEILKAVLVCEPPSPIDGVSPELNRVLRSCWVRDPDDRWQSAGDLRRELQWIAEGGAPSQPPGQKHGITRREMLAWGTAVAGVATSFVVARRFGNVAPVPYRTRFTITDSPPLLDVNRFQSLPAISPDGKTVAMVARANGRTIGIWIRDMDSIDLRELPGTEAAGSLFWSPDSQWLGFFANNQLKRISPAGGPATRICDTPIGSGATWSKDDVIVFQKDRDGALYQVLATGGEPTPATVLAQGQPGHVHPAFLPDGKTFLFSVVRGPQEGQGIFSAALGSTDARRISPISSNVRYAPSGHLLLHEGGNVVARRFDTNRLVLEGESIPVGNKLYTYEGIGSFDISATGTLIYAEVETRLSQLTWFDRDGRERETVGPFGPFLHMDLSRDEKRVLVERYDGRVGEVWLIDTARGIPTPITVSTGNWVWSPFWSPAGDEFIYAITMGRPTSIYRQTPGTKGLGTKLRTSPMVPAPPSHWSVDGNYVVFHQWNQDGSMDLHVMEVSDDSGTEVKTIKYLSGPHSLYDGRLSPNSLWMAYVSAETGAPEIYISPFPNASTKWRVSSDGGYAPRWRSDGKELFFLTPKRTLMAVSIPTTPDHAKPPVALFHTEVIGTMQFTRSDYAPSKDGQRFLINKRLGETPPQTLQVIIGWRP